MSDLGPGSDHRDRLNPFWAAVCHRQTVPSDRPIVASSLHEAARVSFRGSPGRFGFRRPNELVDLDGRFRRFTFHGTSYVGKRSTRAGAVREAWHARRAASALAPAPWLQPLVPTLVRDDDPNARILVTREAGDSLASRPHETAAVLPWDRLLAAIRTMLDVGVVWSGFLPRNVLPDADGGLVLIDWEDCEFGRPGQAVRAVGDLTLLFWTIGWAHHYGLEAEDFYQRLVASLDVTVVEHPLDRFELAYAAMLAPGAGKAEIRRRCSEATMATEACDLALLRAVDWGRPQGPLSPADVGHLLDELLPQHLSVLYTFACKALLDRDEVARYRHVVELVNRSLVLGTPCEGVGTAPERRRLRLLVLLVVTAALLDGVDPSVGVAAADVQELVHGLCSHSSLAAQICPAESTAGAASAGTSSPSDEAVSLFLSLAAERLGAPGAPFRVRRTADGVSVYDGHGALAPPGIGALYGEVVELITGQPASSHREAVQMVRGT